MSLSPGQLARVKFGGLEVYTNAWDPSFRGNEDHLCRLDEGDFVIVLERVRCTCADVKPWVECLCVTAFGVGWLKEVSLRPEVW